MLETLNNKILNGENLFIMAVGDSITWGLNHCNTEETYCAFLAKKFATAFPNLTVLRYDGIVENELKPIKRYDGPVCVQNGSKQCLTIVKSGVGGNTVRRAINRSSDFTGEFSSGKKPDIFLLMFGINDSLKNDKSKYVTPQKYYEDLKELYDILKEDNPSAKLVFMTPTYNDDGTSAQSSLEPYCDMMKRIAHETESFLIDTHSLWMEHLMVGSDNYGQREWLSGKIGDTCHFSPAGSEKTAEFIFKCLTE